MKYAIAILCCLITTTQVKKNPTPNVVLDFPADLYHRVKKAIDNPKVHPNGKHTVTLSQADANTLMFGLAVAVNYSHARTGVINSSRDSREVVGGSKQYAQAGVGQTKFLSEVNPGDAIYNYYDYGRSNQIGVVERVVDDTHLVLEKNAENSVFNTIWGVWNK